MTKGLDPWIWRILYSLDQLFNIIWSLHPTWRKWGGGYADETISSVVGKQYYWYGSRHWFIRGLYRLLETIDPGHCWRALERDEGFTTQDLNHANSKKDDQRHLD